MSWYSVQNAQALVHECCVIHNNLAIVQIILMKIRNRLKVILDGVGLYNYQPTPELLKQLGNMTARRFFQILRNASQTEMSVEERKLIEDWLMKTFNLTRSEVRLMIDEAQPATV